MNSNGLITDFEEKLHDRSFRCSMMEKYLNAETSVEQERAMAAYYVFNAPDEDEREFAMLLRISLSGNILSEETADEFDRLVCMPSDRPAGKKRRVSGIWIAACLACAASLALFLILRNPDAGINVAGESGFAETFSVVEFTDCIEKMAAVCGESVASVSVNPVGNAAIMIVNLKDNSSMKYLVTCNYDDWYASFIALSRQ